VSPAVAFRGLGLLVFLGLAVPLFGHGCHRWDHDDEPSFIPTANEKTPRK
jgi:hypothetical protein